MGTKERKEREREGRRKQILEATKALIYERGVDGFSIQDIARESELGKGTLYLYFPGKEEILQAILVEAGDEFFSYVTERLTASISGIDAIRTIWQSYISMFGEADSIIVLFGIKNSILPGFPLIEDTSGISRDLPAKKMLNLIADVLARGVADGTLDGAICPAEIAKTVFLLTGGIIDTVARMPVALRNSRTIFEELKRTFEILLRGVAAEGTDRSLLVLEIPSAPGASQSR